MAQLKKLPGKLHCRSTISRFVTLLFLVFSGPDLIASKLEKGFEALSSYDYFKARQLFLRVQAKSADPYASYGLATIFGRRDNPFSNLDSATRYVNMSYHVYMETGVQKKLSGFTIDALSILELADTISAKQFQRARKLNTVAAYDHFLQTNYLCNKAVMKLARYLRDELEYNRTLQANRSDSTLLYMATHPQGNFLQESAGLLDRQLYEETTKEKRAKDYMTFIKKYPDNRMVASAYERLYSIYKQNADPAGLSYFVNTYPKAPQVTEAWKLLFSLSVKAFSFAELKKFLGDHPNFPLKNSILNELELNKLVVYPCQQGDYTGFIDERGKFVINPVYDAATDFYEGLSVVNKNDSVYFINKENVNPFDRVFADAHVFKDGMAPVKINSKWSFMNRQGLMNQKQYDEINELSDNLYVVKVNGKYGALDRFGQIVVEPKFDKLGDFKNGYAYYLENGAYGFVARSGAMHRAEFEWISDFGNDDLAIIRKNNKYGLINTNGYKILEPEFDQVLRTNSNLFMVVNNNQYGFFDPTGCFVTQIAFDFLKEKTPEFYTDGRWFKLIRKGEQALVDENGAVIVNFGTYNELNFPNNGLLLVKRKKKSGYLDKKLVPAIALRYDEASDFSDSLAVVKDNERNILINTAGVELYASNQPLEKISPDYYMVNSEPKAIIDKRGTVLFNNVSHIQRISEGLLAISFVNGEIKLINN